MKEVYEFLSKIITNQKVRDYLLKVLGKTLLGIPDEKFYIWTGISGESRCYVIYGNGFSPRKARRAESERLIKSLKKKGFHPKKNILVANNYLRKYLPIFEFFYVLYILSMKINFCFIRHGESCQNLVANEISDRKKRRELSSKFLDPNLTDNGITKSIEAGKHLHNTLSTGKYDMDIREYKYTTPILLKMNGFDIIGCSPTIRAMETSYYMSLEWNPTNIFVFPHLRECACYENETIEDVNNNYPIKSIKQQRNTLRSEPCYEKLNFKYVIDNPLREEPGNIDKFIKWFGEHFELPDKETVNVLIVTHSHVIARLSGGGVSNNSGFILSTTKENDKILYTKDNLMGFWYFNHTMRTKCPVKKCPGLC